MQGSIQIVFKSALISSLVAAILAMAPAARGQMAQAPAPAIGGSPNRPAVLKFKRYIIRDNVQFRGVVAAYGVMPADWVSQGVLGPRLYLRAEWRDAQGVCACDIYPIRDFTWESRQATHPRGSRPPPADQFDAIEKTFIPLFRPDLANAKVVDKQKMPGLASAIYAQHVRADPSTVGCLAGYEVFEYDFHGQTMREYVRLVVEFFADRSNGLIFWNIDCMKSWRAPKDSIGKRMPIELFTLGALRYNPAWNKMVADWHAKRVKAELDRLNANFAATEARIAEQNASNEAEWNAYWQHSSAQAQQDEAESNYLREISPWKDSDGNEYTLPTQYGYAWSGSDGTILMNNDAGYDPRTDPNESSITWTPMQQAGN